MRSYIREVVVPSTMTASQYGPRDLRQAASYFWISALSQKHGAELTGL